MIKSRRDACAPGSSSRQDWTDQQQETTLTNRDGDSANLPGQRAQKIAHEIETQLQAGQPLHSVFHDEIHQLEKLDSKNGHLNKSQFASDLHQVDAQLHKDKFLTNLHIVMDKNDHPKLRKDHSRHGRPSRHLNDQGKSGDYTPSAPGSVSHYIPGELGPGEIHRPANLPAYDPIPQGEGQGDLANRNRPQVLPGDQLSDHRRLSPPTGNTAEFVPPTRNTTDAGLPDPDQTYADRSNQTYADRSNQTYTDRSDQAVDLSNDPNRPNLANLKDAVARANSGGAPVSILQYGDSHVAGGTEPKTIEAEFSKIAPVNYSTMAKVGISASYPLNHEQSWINQPLQDKKPDLVILSFGSNDAAGNVNKQAYERQYEQLVQKIHQQSPNASIYIVGPTDGYGSGTGKPLPGLDNVIAAQKEVAAKYGLDFFDMRASMGGAGSINDWRARGLAGPDKLHFTQKGYQIIAKSISDHLESDLSAQTETA